MKEPALAIVWPLTRAGVRALADSLGCMIDDEEWMRRGSPDLFLLDFADLILERAAAACDETRVLLYMASQSHAKGANECAETIRSLKYCESMKPDAPTKEL